VWLQWYVRPAGELTVFTLFPWAGFVFAGAAVGVLVAATRRASAEHRLQTALAAAGAALVVAGFYTATRPSIYADSGFWTSSPTWFAIRVGILMVSLSAIYAVGSMVDRYRTAPSRSGDALATVGRNSLFIYWIHVELIYGYASWLWRHKLPVWGTAIGYVLFCILIYRALGWRDRIVAGWRRRPRPDLVSAASSP
jgi:uncharacterized membrane protein